MVYSSISKGFRKGGINQIMGPNGQPITGIPLDYNSDTTTNYEVGSKLSFPAQRATLDVALYHIDWQNIQVVQLASVEGSPLGQQFVENAGGAKVDGFELEAVKDVIQGLTAQMSFSIMNPVITKNAPGYDVSVCLRGCPPRVGDQIPYVSHVTGSASLNYRHPLWFGHFSGFAALNWQYTGPRDTDFSRTSVTGDTDPLFRELTANILTSGQLGMDNGSWRLTVYGDNLLDRHNVIYSTPSLSPPGTNNDGDLVLIDRPLTVGFWIRYSFN
jgi:outer membrane receptor protein involved in Fe transport